MKEINFYTDFEDFFNKYYYLVVNFCTFIQFEFEEQNRFLKKLLRIWHWFLYRNAIFHRWDKRKIKYIILNFSVVLLVHFHSNLVHQSRITIQIVFGHTIDEKMPLCGEKRRSYFKLQISVDYKRIRVLCVENATTLSHREKPLKSIFL